MSNPEANLTTDQSQTPADVAPVQPILASNQDHRDYQNSQKQKTADNAAPVQDGQLHMQPLPDLQITLEANAATTNDQSPATKTTTFSSPKVGGDVQLTTSADGTIVVQAVGTDSSGYPDGQKGGFLKIAPDGTASATFPDGYTVPNAKDNYKLAYSHEQMSNMRSAQNPNGSLTVEWDDREHRIYITAEPGEDPAVYAAEQQAQQQAQQAQQQAQQEQQKFVADAMQSIETVLLKPGLLSQKDMDALEFEIKQAHNIGMVVTNLDTIQKELDDRAHRSPDVDTVNQVLRLKNDVDRVTP